MAQSPFDPRDFEYRDYRQEWRFLWERFRRWLTSASWIVVVLIVGLYALSGFYTVGPSEVGLVIGTTGVLGVLNLDEVLKKEGGR